MLYSKEKLKGTKEYIIKSFAFCYNNYYLTHQEAKYGVEPIDLSSTQKH